MSDTPWNRPSSPDSGTILIPAHGRHPPDQAAPPMRDPVVRWWRAGLGGWALSLTERALRRLEALRRVLSDSEKPPPVGQGGGN